MIDSRQVEVYSKAAQAHYSDTLAYHNWSHAEAVMRDVDLLVDRAAQRGIILARGALHIAAAWHDAGFHEDHVEKGFATKEHYSAHLLEEYIADKPVDFAMRFLMTEAILGTIHGFERHTLDTLALHRADVANIGGPYDEFYKISTALWRENIQFIGTDISWDDFIHNSEGYIRAMAKEATIELPRLGEPIGKSDSYDTQALRNAEQLLSEPAPDTH